ncbi:hypothetical protein FQN54_008273 [Arachnomyces sp. PD_36]|nr:hypothetical protein FQN54_008273 [Arachnomyces sp. PD_36]
MPTEIRTEKRVQNETYANARKRYFDAQKKYRDCQVDYDLNLKAIVFLERRLSILELRSRDQDEWASTLRAQLRWRKEVQLITLEEISKSREALSKAKLDYEFVRHAVSDALSDRLPRELSDQITDYAYPKLR